MTGGIIVLAGIYLARRASYARQASQENVA